VPAGPASIRLARCHSDTASTDYDKAALRANEVGYTLADPRLIEDWVEWDDGITNSIMTLFPCLNLQHSFNTVAIRQTVPRGPFESELFWTFLVIGRTENGSYAAGSNFHILRSGADGPVVTYGCGRHLDEIVPHQSDMRFRSLSGRRSTRDPTVSELL
jgi:hypothetical protein